MPGEDDKKKQDETVLADLNKSISGLPDSMRDAVAKGVAGALRAEAARREEENIDDDDDDDDDPSNDAPTDDDLEKMSRGEFARHIAKQFDAQLNKLAKVQEKRTDEVSMAQQKERLAAQIKKLKDDHPDFEHFKEPMAAIAKESPYLAPEDIYQLARARSPEIVKKLDEEAAEAKKKEDEENKKKEKDTPKFGGLTPTSGSPGTEENAGRMKPKEAVDKAWEEAMAGIPDHIIGGNA